MSATRSKILFALALTVLVLGLSQLKVEWPQKLGATSSSSTHWTESNRDVAKGDPAVADALKLNQLFTGLAEKLSMSVVSIFTKTRVATDPRLGQQAELFRFFFGNPFGGPQFNPQPRESQSLGSGFVINSDGVIVTNSHVVRSSGRNADEVLVKFVSDPPNFEGHPVEIRGVDESTDVAVIKLKKAPAQLKSAILGNSSQTKVGEWVLAIGNPYGHSHSVTAGIVSALGRSIDQQTRTDFIQTDASINPGNSGGPLFNIHGEVIGINTAIDARAQGIGFAIPIDTAKTVIAQLIDKGKVDLGYIGVYLADVNPGIAKELKLPGVGGALIQDVIPGGPAEKAGLQSYDVVVSVNDRPVGNTREFMIIVSNLSVGSKARLKTIRDGKEREFIVSIERRKSESELAQESSKRNAKDLEASKGLGFLELTPQWRNRLGLPANLAGVLIDEVAPGSFAASAGLAPGDVLLEVNRKPVRNIKEARQVLSAKGDQFLLKIQRQSATIIILMDASE